MQSPVSPSKPGAPPSVLASPQERARAVQAVLDKDGPEMDRRRELTQGVVDAGIDLEDPIETAVFDQGDQVAYEDKAHIACRCDPVLERDV